MSRRRAPLRRGDLCHHGSSSYPVYAVISVHDGRAWLRDISSGVEAIVDVDRCTRLEPEEAQKLEVDLRRAANLPPRRPSLAPDQAPD
jgi:hypothetical protein